MAFDMVPVERVAESRNVRARDLCRNFDALGVAPEPLEAVELARRRREDVEDEVEVVDQDPLGAFVAFDQRRLGALSWPATP